MTVAPVATEAPQKAAPTTTTTTAPATSSPQRTPSSAPSSVAVALGLDLPSLRRRSQKPVSRPWVLFHPEGAFAAVMARPLGLVALIVVCLWALLPPISFLAAAERSGGLEAVIVDEMKKSGAWEKIRVLPAAERERVMRMTMPVMTIGVPVGAASKRAGWILFVAVACFFVVRGTSPRQLGLGDIVGAVAVGAAPLMVHDLLSAITYVAFELRAIDPQNPVASNAAALVMTGSASRSPLAMLLRGVDVFELWACWLMALGVTQVAQTRSTAPFLITFGAHVVMTVVAIIGAAAAT